MAGSVWRRWNQQHACRFRNLCDTSRRIQLIDNFGTRRYIKQRGRSNVTQHMFVLMALEQQACRYQECQSYEELEDERLLNVAIKETGMVAAPLMEDNIERIRIAEQEVSKEIEVVSEYLLKVHGLPPGRKREGVTRVIYENLWNFRLRYKY